MYQKILKNLDKKKEYLYSNNINITMNKIAFSFLTTTLAGFSTLFGILPCYFKQKKKETIISFSLAFSSGIMLTISVLSLIPEATSLMTSIYKPIICFLFVFLFIVIGINFSQTIDGKIDKKFQNNPLYKLGIISIIVLMLHNIPEGITTFISTTANKKLGITLSLAIALHNIPEGISIAVPIYYATKNRKKAFFYTLISGFSELFGAILAYLFLAKYINNFLLSLILGTTAGIMIHIAIYELLPTSIEYHKPKITIIAFILGGITMLICDALL